MISINIFRSFVLFAFAVILSLGLAIADPPDKPANSIEQRIRKTLDGSVPDSSSEDPILDDILKVIRNRGSVLDGSSLDVETIENTENKSTGTQTSDRNHNVFTAECMLRSARLLSQAKPLDETRKRLVIQMREEARRLLDSSPAKAR